MQLYNIGPDLNLCNENDKPFYYKYHIIPWQKLNNTIFFLIEEITTDTVDWIKTRYGDNYVFINVNNSTVLDFLNSYFGISEFASNYLYYKNSNLSAKDIRLSSKVYSAFILITSIFSLMEEFAYFTLLFIFIIISSSSILKFIATMLGLCKVPNKEVIYNNEDFPVYTILLPVFKESSIILQLIESIENLDYPKSKLDVKLIIESDDKEMIRVITRYALPEYFEVITVPHSLPKTKAKACNYAMCFIKGKYLVIYDAEDKPDSLQLKKALYEFHKNDDNLACVQARLSYYNAKHNLLTKFFFLEYLNWFHYLLPGIQTMNMPVPLGGSSNHFSVKALKEAFFWDAYNVTEDADLGLRLAQMGYKTKIIDSETFEESPITILSWIKQRARWIKGYMETYVVRLRNTTEFRGIVLLNLFVGSTAFTFFSAPFLLFSMILNPFFNELFLYYFIIVYITNSIIFFVIIKQNRLSLTFYVVSLLFPIYKLLHSIAAFLALWEFIMHPQRWNKTNHGVWKQKQ